MTLLHRDVTADGWDSKKLIWNYCVCLMISAVSFSGKDAGMWKISFSKFCHRGQNVIRQTDATVRHSNDDKEIKCDFCLISLCSVPIFL